MVNVKRMKVFSLFSRPFSLLNSMRRVETEMFGTIFYKCITTSKLIWLKWFPCNIPISHLTTYKSSPFPIYYLLHIYAISRILSIFSNSALFQGKQGKSKGSRESYREKILILLTLEFERSVMSSYLISFYVQFTHLM